MLPTNLEYRTSVVFLLNKFTVEKLLTFRNSRLHIRFPSRRTATRLPAKPVRERKPSDASKRARPARVLDGECSRRRISELLRAQSIVTSITHTA